MSPAWGLILFVLASGCSSLRSSAIPTGSVRHRPYQGHVSVSLTRDPPGGVELGVVEASSYTTIEEVVPEFVERVAGLGGNYARIDRIFTRYQWVTRPVQQSYNCGSVRFPMYCSRTYYQQEEIATLHAAGRAFRVGGR